MNDANDSPPGAYPGRKEQKMYEIIWQEFNRKAAIVTKRKSFRTEAAMERFIDKLHDKENFWQIIGYGA